MLTADPRNLNFCNLNFHFVKTYKEGKAGMKLNKKSLIICAAITAALIFSVFTLAATGEYNSENDPLISFSYLEEYVGALKAEYEKEIADLKTENSALTAELDGLKAELDNAATATELAELKSQIEALKNSGGESVDDGRVAELEATIAELTKTIEELKAKDDGEKIAELEAQITALQRAVDAIKNSGGNIDAEEMLDIAYTAVGFVPVFCEYGDIIYPADVSLEVLLRTGLSQVVSPFDSQGLSNITNGTDMLDGTTLIKNHLLIIPRNDGRGVKVLSRDGAWFMIRGEYTIGE